jgi:hypothetical protein
MLPQATAPAIVEASRAIRMAGLHIAAGTGSPSENC